MRSGTVKNTDLEPGLSRRDLRSDPLCQFEEWLCQAEQAGVADANAMTLATVSVSGRPSQRQVLLKHFDARGFTFYTNLHSRKAIEIGGNPQVSMHFAWLVLNRQVIVNGWAEKLSPAEAGRYFISRPRNSRLAAWASQQSQPVASRQVLEQQFHAAERTFARACVPLPPYWGGYRIVPDCIEFWQGRKDRLHDRFLYQRVGEGIWTIERLSP
jgi:pyridoxamine 5'-phosphate oxidase